MEEFVFIKEYHDLKPTLCKKKNQEISLKEKNKEIKDMS